jgi:hypothetical protein
MASSQFLDFLGRLYETGQQQPLRWEPLRRSSYTAFCDFYLALGNGVLRVTSNEDDEQSRAARYAVTLYTREGLVVDDLETCQVESDYNTLLRDLYRQARSAAFNLPGLLAEMQSDLAAGQTREIPQAVLPPEPVEFGNDFGNEFGNDFSDDDDLDIPF